MRTQAQINVCLTIELVLHRREAVVFCYIFYEVRSAKSYSFMRLIVFIKSLTEGVRFITDHSAGYVTKRCKEFSHLVFELGINFSEDVVRQY